VLFISVPGNHASSYAGCDVHSCLENCNVKGFSKSSSKLLEEGTIGWSVDAGNAFILWVEKLRPPVVFLPSKFMVLFICVVSSVWYPVSGL
jgi:hypothetical protein